MIFVPIFRRFTVWRSQQQLPEVRASLQLIDFIENHIVTVSDFIASGCESIQSGDIKHV